MKRTETESDDDDAPLPDRKASDRPWLGGDTRGVSEVVGFLFIAVIVMMLFTGYQAIAVPNQNTETEFLHNQQVEDEMLDVRNAIVDTKLTGQDRHATLRLGTEYTQRMFAINPPHPTGSLRTTEPRDIYVGDGSGEITDEVCGATDLDGVERVQDETRFLEYTPNYNEYQEAGVLRYENSVLYHEFEETTRLRSSQRLIRDDTVTIIPLASDYREQGGRAVSVEPRAGFLSTERVSNPVIRLPTALGEDEWERALAGEVAPGDVTVTDDELRLTLSGSYQIRCGVIGLNAAPETGGRDAFPSTDADIHPSEVAGVRFLGAHRTPGGAAADLRLDFENLADSEITISRAGFNFYQGTHQQPYIDIADNPAMTGSTRLNRNTQAVALDPRIALPGGSTTSAYIEFPGQTNQGAWLVITIQYGTGERTQYFINAQP